MMHLTLDMHIDANKEYGIPRRCAGFISALGFDVTVMARFSVDCRCNDTICHVDLSTSSRVALRYGPSCCEASIRTEFTD